MNIIETHGQCKICGNDEILADGLCRNCWDKSVETSSLKKAYLNSLNICDIHFTSKELEIAVLISRGLGNKIIAEKLGMKTKTLEHHINVIHHKFHAPKWADYRVWLAINIKQVINNNQK